MRIDVRRFPLYADAPYVELFHSVRRALHGRRCDASGLPASYRAG